MNWMIKTRWICFAFLTVSLVACDKTRHSEKKIEKECIGSYENGLTYYIKENPYEKERASLRLAVKIGSLQEEEAQRGLAHFLEHMVFRGSEHYSDYEVVDFLQSIGASFGADTNAYTSFNETVYMFDVPLTKENSLEKAISMLSEFAMKATLADELVEKEKTVVLDELRMRENSSQGRLGTKLFETLLKHTPYAERSPIGLEEVIVSADGAKIREFYEKWYRPENMAIIVVGDFSETEVKEYLDTYFKTLPKSEVKSNPEVCAVPNYTENTIEILEDPESTKNTFLVAQFHERHKIENTQDILVDLIDDVIFSMENRRLYNLSQEESAPFKYAGFGDEGFNAKSDVFVNYSLAWDKEPIKALDQMLMERKKFEDTNFTKVEFELIKASLKTDLKTALENEAKHKNIDYVQKFLSHFLYKGLLLDFKESAEIRLSLLDEITLEKVNERKAFFASLGPKAIVYTPAKQKVALQKEDMELSLKKMEDFKAEETLEKEQKVLSLASKFDKGSIESKEFYDKTNITKIKLSNGLTVYLEKTDLKENLFSLKMFANGGLSSFSKEDLPSAALACSYLNKSGLAGLSSVELSDVLSGKEVSLNYAIHINSRSLSGSSNKEDAPYLFKLIQALFTEPTFRNDAWDKQVKLYEESLEAKKINPDALFFDSIYKFNYSDHYYVQEFPSDALDKAKAENVLQKAFASPSDFTCIIVGDFEEGQLISYLEQYLASIPNSEEKYKEPLFSSFTIPDGEFENVFEMGVGKEATVFVGYPLQKENLSYSYLDNVRMSLYQNALQTRLLKVLRREMGETYGVSTYLDYPFAESVESSSMNVYFTTAPDKVDAMKASLTSEIARVKAEPFTKEELKTSLEIYKTSLEKALLSNSGRLQRIQVQLSLGSDLKSFYELENYENELTPEAFETFITKVTAQNRCIKHIKLPKS